MSRQCRCTCVHVTGSEEDVFCDPCYSEGQLITAVGNCIDCNENFCESCFKVHKKLSALKDHAIQDRSILSHSQKERTIQYRSTEDKDPLTDRCLKHPEELIKFFCNSHGTLACSVCISLDHRLCKDIMYIRDVSDGVANSDEFNKIQTELKLLVVKLTSTQNRSKWIKEIVGQSYSQVVADISNMKEEIIDVLDQLENELLESASLIKEEKMNALDNMVSTCEKLIEETKTIIGDMEKKKSKSHNNRLYISMKNANDQIRNLAENAKGVDDKNNCERLFFNPNEKITDLMSTLTSLGTTLLVSRPSDAKARYQHDINVKTSSDEEDCLITGAIVTPSDLMALTDNLNKSVKLVDLVQLNEPEEIKLESNPLDLTLISLDKIAVTIFEKRYIQIVSFSPDLSKCNTISVPGLYGGIEYNSEKFILACHDPIKGLHICDMSGTLLQQIETDYGGSKLFTRPTRIALRADCSVIYITDFEVQTVISLNINGELIWKYSNEKLQGPTGITVDDDGYIYVCSNDNTIHQLSHSGQQVNILLEEKDGIQFPSAVIHSAGNMYICNGGDEPTYRNNIKVYSFEG